MEYCEILFIEKDADFNKLAHLGHMVKFVLIPLKRKDEFLQSETSKCLFPIGKILYYEEYECLH